MWVSGVRWNGPFLRVVIFDGFDDSPTSHSINGLRGNDKTECLKLPRPRIVGVFQNTGRRDTTKITTLLYCNMSTVITLVYSI